MFHFTFFGNGLDVFFIARAACVCPVPMDADRIRTFFFVMHDTLFYKQH